MRTKRTHIKIASLLTLCLTVSVSTLSYANTDMADKIEITSSQKQELKKAEQLITESETLYQQRQYQQAVIKAKDFVSLHEKVLGTEHVATASSYNKLAGIYRALRKYDKALQLAEKCLMIREKVLGTEHVSTATSYNNVALLYRTMGDYDKALLLYKKALAIDEKVLGTEHMNTATNYHNLAVLYETLGEYKKALPLYKKAFTIVEKNHGKNHPYTQDLLEKMNELQKKIQK